MQSESPEYKLLDKRLRKQAEGQTFYPAQGFIAEKDLPEAPKIDNSWTSTMGVQAVQNVNIAQQRDAVIEFVFAQTLKSTVTNRLLAMQAARAHRRRANLVGGLLDRQRDDFNKMVI